MRGGLAVREGDRGGGELLLLPLPLPRLLLLPLQLQLLRVERLLVERGLRLLRRRAAELVELAQVQPELRVLPRREAALVRVEERHQVHLVEVALPARRQRARQRLVRHRQQVRLRLRVDAEVPRVREDGAGVARHFCATRGSVSQ